MDKVYFLKDFDKLNETTSKLLAGFYPEDSEVLIKLHFGEPGNKTAFSPQDVKPVTEALKTMKLLPVMIDSPVAYNSPRHTVEGYLKAAQERGYEELGKIIISDTGVPVQMKDFKAEVIKELTEASNILVLSHVKGHPCSGFGGAIKNLGMGGVTVKTKNLEHGLCKPTVDENCTGCGTCVDLCPGNAIKIVEGKATFDYDACLGCSICEARCPNRSLTPAKAMFDDLLAQGASAAINNFPQKAYYINVIKNVTQFCDCAGNSGQIISPDIGILLSENPVAIDTASLDLINKINGKDIFLETNKKDPYLHINFAAQYTGKNSDYELIEL